MLTAVAALIGIVVGAVGAAALLIGVSRSRVRTAEAERSRILADTEREADSIRREAQVEAREQSVALRSEIEAEVQGRRLEIVKIEERVSQKEGEVDEKLVDLEDYFRRWRFNHVTTVERVIGLKRGTGGTGGVSYLRRMLEVVLFPELWDVRTTL